MRTLFILAVIATADLRAATNPPPPHIPPVIVDNWNIHPCRRPVVHFFWLRTFLFAYLP